VDDDELILISLEDLLRNAGYDIRCSSSGREALALAGRETFDMVILDVVMPGMSGLDVCRALRADPAYASTPIVLFTAKSSPADRERGADAGATAFLPKPYDPKELLKVVAEEF
jgi:DNA-binding response OmpR family regulator